VTAISRQWLKQQAGELGGYDQEGKGLYFSMFIRLGYEIDFEIPAPTAMVSMLSVHPSRVPDLRAPDELHVEPEVEVRNYIDGFGNRCGRFVAPAGTVRLRGATLIEDPGIPDPVAPHAREHPVGELPHETLIYLLNSRYCEVDRLSNIASDLFGAISPGWGRVQAICNWVNSRVMFGYHHARSTRTALDVFTDRVGVCRDYQHLAIGFCRALNIPARYCTGYLGDIGVPLIPPMDFSAWFEVYLEDRWWVFDARNNTPRIGRVLMATGRDASDVAITTSFGAATLMRFAVLAEETVAPAVVPTGTPS
jgi:transglutaminase-like putative cysteine protease